MKYKLILLMAVVTLIFAGCSQNNEQSGNTDEESNGTSEQAKSDYPNKPIELLVPYPAGGGGDLVARTLASHINKHLPNEQSLTVVNESGGAGVVGTTGFMKAKPDGYQTALIPSSVFVIQTNFGKTSFDYDSFQPILNVSTARQTLLVKKDAPWQDFEEWVEYVKEHPGEFTYATSGVGSTQHIAMEMLIDAAGIDIKHVPYDGMGEAKTALLGGHVQGVVAPLNGADVDSMRALVSFSEEKGESIPDVPLLKDKGYDVELDVLQGLYVPEGTPEEIQSILHDAVKATLEDPDFIEDFKKTQLDITYINAEDYKNKIETLYNRVGDTMKKIGLIE